MSFTKVVIVTAASKGMGAAVARELAEQGYGLTVMDEAEEIMPLADELGAAGVVGSVTDADVLAKVVDVTLDKYGRVDGVYNNTGHPPTGDLLAISDEEWHAALDLVFLNVVRMARLVTPVMLAQGGGAIVNASSLFALEPSLTYPVSSSLRAALSGFTRLYAERYASSGIRMNCLLPGMVDTYLVSDEVLRTIPMGRLARVTDVAKLACFLLSDDASYITGQSIRIDGGLGRSI